MRASSRAPDLDRDPDQVAAIAIRRNGTGIEVCLIRRRGRRKWGVPKGFVDDGDTPVEAALTEAREEAGLIGRIDRPAVGMYTYSKWGDQLTVAVYVMTVTAILPVWDEMDVRDRRWTTPDDVEEMLDDHPVLAVWEQLRERLEDYVTG